MTSEAAREEVERAARYYYYSPLQQGIDNRTKRFIVERCERFIRPPQALDLGYVDGLWTDVLLAKGCMVDVVEGASRHVEHARQKYAGNASARVFHALFQEFEAPRSYDTVVAGDMLRYVPDALEFLKRVRGWMKEDGVLIVTVPNSRSLHRRVGALMKLEGSTPTDPNERDREVGNRRSYDRYQLRDVLLRSGFRIKELRGCFLKPLSSEQMKDWSDELLRAFLEVGDEIEDYCWFLYGVGEK